MRILRAIAFVREPGFHLRFFDITVGREIVQIVAIGIRIIFMCQIPSIHQSNRLLRQLLVGFDGGGTSGALTLFDVTVHQDGLILNWNMVV